MECYMKIFHGRQHTFKTLLKLSSLDADKGEGPHVVIIDLGKPDKMHSN